MRKNIIELNGLSKFYGEHRGIEELSFTVEKGDIYGFIGPNGAGKTTTIRTLLALIHPTSGTATILGKDCIKEADQIAREVGYLPSEAFYYENKKKVGIVAALLHSPKLVILDEPTSGLDPLIQQRFFEILREENQKGDCFVIDSRVCCTGVSYVYRGS